MSVSGPDREHEDRRLEAVIGEIELQLRARTADVAKYRSLLTGTQEFLKEEKPRAILDFEALVEVAGGMSKLKEAAKLHKFSAARAQQLERLLKSPYFARIDFREDRRDTGARVPHDADDPERGDWRVDVLGRVPGRDLAGEVQKVYIGISSLTKEDTGEHLVFDWRAPVSSMYYDFELGEAHYEAPAGIVRGEILLKRHFRIRDGRIEMMFDNSLTIYDEMLQEALQKATGDRMRSIVNTIQREQNQIIRGENRGALVVQGSAGSGKTVIALHRAAYLLYKYRSTMNARNIVMFSPGKLFVDYTSPVLPELGEEPIQQISFGDFARQWLVEGKPFGPSPQFAPQPAAQFRSQDIEAGARPSSGGGEDYGRRDDQNADNTGAESPYAEPFPLRIEDVDEQLEYLLGSRESKGYQVRAAGIRMKSSAQFTRLIEAYAASLTTGAKAMGDVVFRGKMVMSREEAAQLLKTDYAYLPLEKRMDKIKRRAIWLLDEFEPKRAEEIEKEILAGPDSQYLFRKEIRRMSRIRAHEEVQAVRDRIRSWGAASALKAYIRLYQDADLFRRLTASAGLAGTGALGRDRSGADELEQVRAETLERLSGGTLPFEDLSPLLFLKGLLEGFPELSPVRHVIVDEVQDYTPAQHEVLKRSFTLASFTLLGDLNQAMGIHAAGAGWEDLYREIEAVYGGATTGGIRQGRVATAAPGTVPGANTGAVIPVRLTESYRSTRDITEFTRAMLQGGEPVEAIERPGELPLLVRSSGQEDLARDVLTDIRALREDGLTSIAIICKTARESWKAWNDLSAMSVPSGKPDRKDAIHLVKADDRQFRRGVLVIPSYLAKGLEFEAVVIYDAGVNTYSAPGDRRVLYTACTRALHRLHIHYSGTVSPFISQVGPSMYHEADGIRRTD